LTINRRPPARAKLDDAPIIILRENLRAARNAALAVDPSDDPAPASLLRAAIRRVELERRKRGNIARETVGNPVIPAVISAATAKIPVVATSRRKPATSTRTPAGRKSSDARKTDQRTEPHRVVKRVEKPSVPASTAVADAHNDTVTRKNIMSLTEAEKAIKQAARKAEKEATKVAEKEAAREARRAERKALKDAEKEEARLERRAVRKAEKDAERQAEKQAERAERKAARLAEEESVAPVAEPEAVKPKAAKPGKGKGAGTGTKKSQ
jgi:colicin import membrane protein